MFFTLERVENGYILTAKEEKEGLTQEAQFRKEVVTDELIDQRIGHLLCLDTLKKEHPVVFHVEAIGEKTYKIDDMPNRDNLMVAKLSFAHFNARKYSEESIVMLQITDTNMLEIYGRDAESIAEENDIALNRADGIPFLRYPNNKDGVKTLASYVKNPAVVRASEAQIMEWYNSHKVKQEVPPTPPPATSSNKNSNTSNTTKK